MSMLHRPARFERINGRMSKVPHRGIPFVQPVEARGRIQSQLRDPRSMKPVSR